MVAGVKTSVSVEGFEVILKNWASVILFLENVYFSSAGMKDRWMNLFCKKEIVRHILITVHWCGESLAAYLNLELTKHISSYMLRTNIQKIFEIKQGQRGPQKISSKIT